jgi:hypothetical protein
MALMYKVEFFTLLTLHPKCIEANSSCYTK